MDLHADLRGGLHKCEDQEANDDFYDSLDPLLQASIDQGLEQIKRGETVSHRDVRRCIYEEHLKK